MISEKCNYVRVTLKIKQTKEECDQFRSANNNIKVSNSGVFKHIIIYKRIMCVYGRV